jgi:hypothetical protein
MTNPLPEKQNETTGKMQSPQTGSVAVPDRTKDDFTDGRRGDWRPSSAGTVRDSSHRMPSSTIVNDQGAPVSSPELTGPDTAPASRGGVPFNQGDK